MQSVNDSNFEEEVLNAKGTVLVQYSAEWCNPCKALTPRVQSIVEQVTAKVVKVDIDSSFESSMRNSIRTVPTMILYKDGLVVKEARGCSKMTENEIKEFVNA